MADTKTWTPNIPSYPGATWQIEKTENVVRYIAHLLADVNKQSDVSDELRETILNNLSPMAWDALKLYAQACEVDWSIDDRAMLLSGNMDGFHQIQVKYGQRRETKNDRLRREVQAIVETSMSYLNMPRSDGRTPLYDVLRRPTIVHPLLEQFAELLDQVTDNLLGWDEFVVRGKVLLSQLEASVDSEQPPRFRDTLLEINLS